MIEFIKNNRKLSLWAILIFMAYAVSSFYQQGVINALEEDVFLAKQEIYEKSKPSQLEVTKTRIDNLYSERSDEKTMINDMKEQIFLSHEYVYQLESKIRCEKENLLWTGGIDCSVDFINYPLKK